jgi:CheY-like chemotaxis protein
MPLQDGYSFLRKLRSEEGESLRNIPAVALSAYAHAEDRKRAVSAGFQEYASKPIAPETLVRIVAGLVRSRLPG